MFNLQQAILKHWQNKKGGLDCSYNRHPSKCEIYVGTKGKIKLLGGTIISAGADDYVRFNIYELKVNA